jgi:hypothetical protein
VFLDRLVAGWKLCGWLCCELACSESARELTSCDLLAWPLLSPLALLSGEERREMGLNCGMRVLPLSEADESGACLCLDCRVGMKLGGAT